MPWGCSLLSKEWLTKQIVAVFGILPSIVVECAVPLNPTTWSTLRVCGRQSSESYKDNDLG